MTAVYKRATLFWASRHLCLAGEVRNSLNILVEISCSILHSLDARKLYTRFIRSQL